MSESAHEHFEGKHHEGGKHHEADEVRHHESAHVSQTPSINYVLYALLVSAVVVIAFNQFLIFNVSSSLSPGATGAAVASAAKSSGPLSLDDIVRSVIPTGVPAIYGSELGVSYDKPVEGMSVLGRFDNGIELSGEKLRRYINVTTRISCEYCCGAKSITFENGKAACGCAHSAAMRGLAKYLLDKHAGEYTDEQVLNELAKWKALFYPKQTIQKAVEFASKNGAIDSSSLTQLNQVPSMVGGC